MEIKKIKRIVITKRSDDYHAALQDHPEIWDCGNDPRMAIGNLIMTHKERFNIQLEWANVKIPSQKIS